MIRNILNSILLVIDRTTHKITYRTRKGIVQYFSMPLGSSPSRYADAGVAGVIKKIFIWHPDSVEELEEMLRVNGVEMVEIVKEGPTSLELKRPIQ